MRQFMAALAALLVALPASATVTGNPPPTNYACAGGTVFTIPWPYIAASHVVATQTTAGGITTTVIGTVKPSIAPASGTITLGTACPSGSVLTLTRVVPFTQPQSFRTGSYSGPVHEQAFDRLEMQVQQLSAKEIADIGVVNNTVAAFNASGAAIGSTTSVLATSSTTPRTLAARFAETVNVKDFGAKGDGSADDASAIQAAINSFGTTPACGPIFLPRGTYNVGTMIDVNNREGCIFMGAGHGQTTSSCSTTLKWTGASGGTVLRVFSTRWSSFRDFCIDGNSLAGMDIDLTALNATSPSQQDHFINIMVKGVGASPNRAIHIGSAANDQISEVSFDGIICVGGPTCFYQDGNQTKNIRIIDGLISHPTAFGIDVEGGELLTQHMDFQNNTGGTTDVKVAGSANVAKVVFIDNYHEDIGSATITAYSFPSGARVEPTTFIGGRVLYTSTTGGTVLDYQQQGPVALIGTIFTGNAPSQGGTISFNGPGASPNNVALHGVAFYNSNTLSCAGQSACIYDAGGAVLSATTSAQYRNKGIDLWGSSLNFSTSTGTSPFKIRQNSTQFQFLDSSNNVLGAFAGDTAAVTGTWSVSKLRAATGISADAGGFKHLRGVVGCVTGAAAGATCNTTVTWTTAFANSAYTAVCVGRGVTSGVPVLGAITSVTGAAINIQTVAVTAVAAQFTNVDCVAPHD